MAGWLDWYSGDMAPPNRTPGGYVAAPSFSAPMSVEEMYQGIYGPASPGLATRTVQSVPVPLSAVTAAAFGIGTGMRGSGDVDYKKPVWEPNVVPGTVRDLGSPQYGIPGTGGGVLTPSGLPQGSTTKKTFDDRLNPGVQFGGGGTYKAGAGGYGSGSLTPKMPSPKVLELDFEPMSDVSGQNLANSRGAPVRGPSGKTYYPSDITTSKIRAPMSPVGDGGTNARGAPKEAKVGLLGLLGALGGLFGNSGGGAGLLGSLGGPGSGAPGWSNPNITYNDYRYTPGEATTLAGNDMAFMPTSVQESSRWQTGY